MSFAHVLTSEHRTMEEWCTQCSLAGQDTILQLEDAVGKKHGGLGIERDWRETRSRAIASHTVQLLYIFEMDWCCSNARVRGTMGCW
jgi:hypothetical protein